jgi:peptidoglycan/LPS O-acetylase OafA/YrhL
MADRYRIAALDGLRGLAVLMVLLAHSLPIGSPHPQEWFGARALGAAGVRLFLVLSGFLITKTLLEARDSSHALDTWTLVRRFYLRRALRLTPVYYATLAVATVLRFGAMLEPSRVWYWLYASNLYTVLTGIHHRSFAHFWSLALEEQFYLFWPWVALWIPRYHLLRCTVAVIVAAVAFRWWLVEADNPLAGYMLMPARMDALGVGAACAIARASPRLGRALCVGGLLWWAFVLWLEVAGVARFQPWHLMSSELASVTRDAGLVVLAAHGARSLLGDFLTLPALVSLGRISYAVYVFHFLIPEAYSVLSRAGGPSLLPEQHGGLRLVAVAVPTILLAAASWRFMEQPLAAYYRTRWSYQSDRPGVSIVSYPVAT